MTERRGVSDNATQQRGVVDQLHALGVGGLPFVIVEVTMKMKLQMKVRRGSTSVVATVRRGVSDDATQQREAVDQFPALGVGEYTFVIVEVTMKMMKVRIRTCLVIRMLRMILITNSNYV